MMRTLKRDSTLVNFYFSIFCRIPTVGILLDTRGLFSM